MRREPRIQEWSRVGAHFTTDVPPERFPLRGIYLANVLRPCLPLVLPLLRAQSLATRPVQEPLFLVGV